MAKGTGNERHKPRRTLTFVAVLHVPRHNVDLGSPTFGRSVLQPNGGGGKEGLVRYPCVLEREKEALDLVCG